MVGSAGREPGERLALFRFSVISAAINPTLTPAERGFIVRRLAASVHTDPAGEQCRFSRGTIDRWLADYRRDGLTGLRPRPRVDAGASRANHAQWMNEAARLRREVPARSAAQIVDIIGRAHGVWLSERTVRAHLARHGLSRSVLTAETVKVFGRFEASRPNEIWIGDVLVGPFVPYPRVGGSRRAKLFLLVDDHSRLIVHGRWMTEENTRAGQDVLRAAIDRRGVPETLHVDNGAPYSNAQLSRTCAVLGVHLVHSKPYSPQGRGKQERLNRFIRERFLVEAQAVGIASFDELNDRFAAWSESVANARVHAETKQRPIDRFFNGHRPRIPERAVIAEAFRWSAVRVVTKTATVSFLGNRYQVEPALVGRRVELRFDPENLETIDVYLDGLPAGVAVPFVIGRHVHPAVPQANPEPAPPAAPSIDYLGLVENQHESNELGAISYRDIPLPGIGDDTGEVA
jgi:putative transposase